MKIEIYTTENCFHCKSAKDYFKKQGLDYIEHNVTDDIEKARDIFRLSGQLGVPTIIIDGEVVVGFNERKIKELINGRGK